MILGQIAYLDCLVFVLSLIPQLLLNVNFFELLGCGLRLVPFLCTLTACFRDLYRMLMLCSH